MLKEMKTDNFNDQMTTELEKLNRRSVLLMGLLAVAVILTFSFCVGFGSLKIGLDELIKIIFRFGDYDPVLSEIVWDIRFPRTIGALLGGAALAVAGIMLQVFFRNPIVEPFVLGISSGAVLCVALVMLGGISLGFGAVSPMGLFLAALLGSSVVMIVVLMFATRVKDVVSLLVIGLMMGYICSAVTSVLQSFAEKEALQGFVVWTLGSFSGFTWASVRIIVALCIPIFGSLVFLVKPLNAFSMGEEYAMSMGVNIKRFRIFLVAITSILAAVVTAFAGPVGFIGLAIPHLARLLFKTADNKILVPGSILMGGSVTACCDLISRTILAPVELPISAVTAFIGAPIVIYLIMKRRTSL
jgi:iron complex transport system permease protein